MLTSYVQQNKINKIDNDLGSWAMVIRLLTAKILLSINQVFFMQLEIFIIVCY